MSPDQAQSFCYPLNQRKENEERKKKNKNIIFMIKHDSHVLDCRLYAVVMMQNEEEKNFMGWVEGPENSYRVDVIFDVQNTQARSKQKKNVGSIQESTMKLLFG